MASTASPPLVAPPKSRGRLPLLTGILATIAGLALYALQMQAGKLTTPWYVPVLASLGTGLILLSLLRRFTAWRILALLLIGAAAAGEWWFILSIARQPTDTHRIIEGKQLPDFSGLRADGTPFTRDSLKGDQNTVLVFFRGHW